jgi:3-deoxy-manno-octulosonate cytidylyltransferase (CMP-KDO synthetase)
MASVEMCWRVGIDFPASPLEDLERLEQLRLIEAGLTMATFEVQGTSLSVDTAEQLEQARSMV